MGACARRACAARWFVMELQKFYEASAARYDHDWGRVWEGAHSAFYQRLAQAAGGPVIEMGCGTGLVLLPLARAGVTVHGRDFSPAMLRECECKLAAEPEAVRARVTLSRGDARYDSAGGTVALVIAPGHVISTFCERADQRAFLRNARSHLAPGGAFCFDVFEPDYRMLAANNGEVWQPLAEGASIRVTHQPPWQRQLLEMRWTGPEGERTASTLHRWFTHAELQNLLELEGFRITDEWGGFDGRAYGEGVTQQIFRAVVA